MMKRLPNEFNNNFPIRMEDKVKIIERLRLEVSTLQQATPFLKTLITTKHGHALKNPEFSYLFYLVFMCDLATNWIS